MTRAALVLTVAAASSTVFVPAVTTPAAASTGPGSTHMVTVLVRPAVAGIPLLLHGGRYVSDDAGRVVLPATDAELASKRALLQASIRIPPTALSRELHIRFARWVGTTATVVLRGQVRVDLADPQGRRVDPRVAPIVVVRGSDGSEVRLRSGRRTWLTATVPVPRAGSGWAVRAVRYAVREVRVHGTNVVQQGQQVIVPARTSHATIKALFFGIRFASRDALLGSPRGHVVAVRFPDGHVERRRLDGRAEAVIDGLPRGNYQLTVRGPGLTSSQPVALSRTLDVQLRMITWLDIALVGAALTTLAIALPIAARWRPRLLGRRLRPTAPGGPPRA